LTGKGGGFSTPGEVEGEVFVVEATEEGGMEHAECGIVEGDRDRRNQTGDRHLNSNLMEGLEQKVRMATIGEWMPP